MEKDQRAKLLRDRLLAIRGRSFALRLSPGKPKPVPEVRNRFHSRPIPFACGPTAKELRFQWLYSPDQAKTQALKVRRIARKSPLAGIAEKWGTPEWFQKSPRLSPRRSRSASKRSRTR